MPIAQFDEEDEKMLPQEEIIDSFEETLAESTEELSEDEDEADFPEDDALMIPHVDDAVEVIEHEDASLESLDAIDVMVSLPEDNSIASLDDLSENLLKSAFGEAIDEEMPETLTAACYDNEDTKQEEKIRRYTRRNRK